MGESEAAEGGGIGFFIENPREGEGFSGRGRGRGAGRVSAANWGIFLGGGLKNFFPGQKRPHRCVCVCVCVCVCLRVPPSFLHISA